MKKRFCVLFFIANFLAINAFCQDPIIGEIKLVPYTFVPMGYMACEGQTLNISDYSSLFAVIGTTYGGNGSTTFKLPDLRGRAMLGAGNSYGTGAIGGSETTTLVANNLPPHTHTATVTVNSLPCNSATGGSTSPTGVPAKSANTRVANNYSTTANAKSGNMQALSPSSGNSQAISIMKPFLAMQYIIAVEGIFPERY